MAEGASHCAVRKQSTKSAQGLWSPIVATYVSLRTKNCIFGRNGTPCTPRMHFPSVTGKNMDGKRTLLDGMEHVYLCGYHFSGSATHISRVLMGIEM